ncbi:probable serine/threonine-protein kinase clkA [Bactrocera tryoni]|uniref:probable serine/threonine-protein kinase clkA n=1 Tax=Bactrocera tryoni TaxID=59916 RepID=UPI001A981043|nr:probable serine/threonine-protein kinase clkA [Bactrocera tryoni]
MGSNLFYPKNKLDFENSFKQYITQVYFGDEYIIKRKRIHSDYPKENNIKRRKINSIDKETKPNKSDTEHQNFNMETASHSLPPKDSIFNNRYYPTKRKNNIRHLRRSKSTKNVAHENNVAFMNVGAENTAGLYDAHLNNYFYIPDEPVVQRNFKTHEVPKPYASLNAEFKVVRQSYNNFTVVPLINNEAKVDRNFPVNGVTNVNGALYSTFNDFKINYNNLNIIPIANANSNVIQNNYWNFSTVPFTNTESVLGQFIANEVPESKDATNVNLKVVELNYDNLNAVPVIDSEPVLKHFLANEVSKRNGATKAHPKVVEVNHNNSTNAVPVMNGETNEASKSNGASNVNFKADTYNFLVNRKNKSSTSINLKVNQVPSDHQMVENEVPKCDKAQDVNFKITDKTKDGIVLVDHFTVVSEDNIANRAEVNENFLLTNKSDNMTLDEEFDMNLDFLNETEEDFAVNFDQLINMVEDSYTNTSTSLDTNQDSKKNCDLESYLAVDEFNSFITF